MRKPRVDQNGLVHALLYRRVSGAEHQRKGLSLETQTEALREYIARQDGWIIDNEYVDVMSGRRADRRGYQAMLARAKSLQDAGSRVAVVIVRIDRFGRRVREYLNVAEELIKSGAVIHTTESGAELDEEWATMKMAWAQKEGKLIGQRVRENRATVVKNGWWYGRVAFGYRLRPATAEEISAGCRTSMGMIEPDPLTYEIAAELFRRVADGESVHSVARWLAGLPAASRGNRSWGHQSVRSLLRSPTYIRRPAVGADDVLTRPVARWKPLVSDELWATVHQKMAGHPSPGRWPSGRYLLTGFLHCARCDSRMGVTGGGRSSRGYRCLSKERGANAPRKGCQYGVPVHLADRAVLSEISDALLPLSDPKQWPALGDAWREIQVPKRDGPARRLAELDRAEKNARHELADAARMLISAKDRVAYEALRDELVATIDAIGEERKALGAASRPTARTLPPLDDVLRRANGWGDILCSSDVALQRPILESLAGSVRLNRMGWGKYAAVIEWTYLGEALRSLAQEHAAFAA
jgi:DNA invertase Pin-like site-specific DNA recombinase